MLEEIGQRVAVGRRLCGKRDGNRAIGTRRFRPHGWLQLSVSFCAIARAVVSTPPPAAMDKTGGSALQGIGRGVALRSAARPPPSGT